jgi:hypothetical protein
LLVQALVRVVVRCAGERAGAIRCVLSA